MCVCVLHILRCVSRVGPQKERKRGRRARRGERSDARERAGWGGRDPLLHLLWVRFVSIALYTRRIAWCPCPHLPFSFPLSPPWGFLAPTNQPTPEASLSFPFLSHPAMVLEDLGSSITRALADLSKKAVVDDAALKDLLNDMTRALLSGDVRVSLVRTYIRPSFFLFPHPFAIRSLAATYSSPHIANI